MNIVERLIKWAYAPRDKIMGKYDLVVAIDYGSVRTTGDVLPLVGKATLRKAAELVNNETARDISWGNAINYLANNEEMNRAKVQEICILTEMVVMPRTTTCTNTIQEAENIIKLFPSARRIILVCEWRHAPRTKLIWRKLTKGTCEIDVVTVDADWTAEKHPSVWCNSNWKFLLMNVVYHAILFVPGGMRRLQNKTHKLK